MKKVIVCGPYNAGKTTFIKNINDNDFSGTDEEEIDIGTLTGKGTTTTVSVEVTTYRYQNGELLFVGVPGQERFDFIWEIIGQDFDAILFLYPANESIETLKSYINFFSKMKPFPKALKMIIVTHYAEVKHLPIEKITQFGFPVKIADPRKKEQVLDVVKFIVSSLKGENNAGNF